MEIFNFSFLDILACTIGLLIFIMVMVFILQSNSPVADTAAITDRNRKQASALDAEIAQQTHIADALEAQLSQLRVPGQPDLSPQRDSAKALRDQAKIDFTQNQQAVSNLQALWDQSQLKHEQAEEPGLAQAQSDLANAHRRFDDAKAALAEVDQAGNKNAVVLLPYSRPGQAPERYQILHVDCHRDQVVMLKEVNNVIAEVGRTDKEDLGENGSSFQKLVAKQMLEDHPLILFWVRPDGNETSTTAEAQLPENTPNGSEPADANWSLVSTLH